MPRPPLAGTVASLVYWSRLEPLPAAAPIDEGLRAAIADPLWLLARQWQFGELDGEDAGSPVDLVVETEAARLSRIQLGPPSTPVHPYDPADAPLEALVEAEPVRAGDVGLAADGGIHARRMLVAADLVAAAGLLSAAYPLAVPSPEDPIADPGGMNAHLLLAGRVPDGRALAADLAGPDGDTVATRLGVEASTVAPVQRVLDDWLRWYDALVLEPPGVGTTSESMTAPPAWDERRLEHRFATSAVHSGGGITVAAARYRDGTIDWPDVEVVEADGLGSVFGLPQPVGRSQRLLPTAVRFPGMPARRFWEIEDTAVSFAGLDPGLTDVGRVLLAEFGLVYGNDWYAVPIEVPLGTLLAVGTVTVTDAFGVTTTLTHITRTSTGISAPRPWSVAEPFAPPELPDRVRQVVPMLPSVAAALQGEPIERVEFGRDEMANLVWAVEHVVSGTAGSAVDRTAEVGATPSPPTADPTPAALAYRLTSPVPAHWVAYAPAPVPGEPPGVTQLERQATESSRARVTAESAVIEEAEVPAGGIVVERAWQLARTPTGRSVLWVGRRVRSGAGPVASGLAWDRVTPA